jgi:tetratricopeptide (TPR) repeat protein
MHDYPGQEREFDSGIERLTFPSCWRTAGVSRLVKLTIRLAPAVRRERNMATSDVPASTALPASPRRRRRWYWLLAGSVLLLAGAWAAAEGWANWQERLAAQALADDDMEAARRHIESALLVHRRRVSTLLLAARIRRLRGGYSEAEHYLLRCEKIEGMSEPVQLEWMLLRCQQDGVDELGPKLLTLAKKNHPQAPAILETLASVYMRHMRYLEALVCLDLWLTITPDSVRGLDWRGWVNYQLDHRQHADRDYQHLLELQPQRADIRLRLAQVLLESPRPADAVPHLEQLLREQPDNPDVATALARCRIDEGRTDEAQALLDKVLQDQPDHFDALMYRGKLECNLGRSDTAERWLKKALAVRPHDKEAHYLLYRCLQALPGRQKDAERAFAQWEQESKRQDRLTRLMRMELAAQPDNADLAREAGELFFEVGQDERGLFWLYRALAINPHHVPSRQALLAYYERTNQPDKAAEQRQQLAEIKNHE